MKCGGHQEQWLPLPEGSKVPRASESFTTRENWEGKKGGWGKGVSELTWHVSELKAATSQN